MQPKILDEIVPSRAREAVNNNVGKALLIYLIVGLTHLAYENIELANVLHRLAVFHVKVIQLILES